VGLTLNHKPESFYTDVAQRQKDRSHAGHEVSETAKAVAHGGNAGGDKSIAKPQAVHRTQAPGLNDNKPPVYSPGAKYRAKPPVYSPAAKYFTIPYSLSLNHGLPNAAAMR
jgi:hypothetical protein